ncbi:MAG: hypothetical protein ACT6FF_08795 [Methanosarcinaceae archaeon]
MVKQKFLKSRTVCPVLWIGFIFLLGLPFQTNGQIRAGAGYLKMLHGAREVGAAGTLTGALDHTYSFYANPAATGFLREWQWSATYTNWISDVYNASFMAGKSIRTPWSRFTKIALGLNYLGIPEFDNTNESTAPVSGHNLLLTTSLAQPFPVLNNQLSFGANFKYFNNKFAGYNTHKIIFDLGLLLRTPRFPFLKPENGLFDFIIFSSGISITNQGTPITFIAEKTPLPLTVRAGVAANLGAHHGLQLNLGTDYRVVRDETGYFSVTSELSWRQLISLKLGYSWEDNLLGHFVFSGGLRFDDLIIPNSLPGQNNAVRLDLAANQNNSFFAAPYHGSITHQPIGPEYFKLLQPEYEQKIDTNHVNLAWEWTRDPDLFDQVTQRLLVDPDQEKLLQIINSAEKNRDSLFYFLENGEFLINSQVTQTEQIVHDLPFGDYFWAVLATDKDQHPRFGEMEAQSFGKFHITTPDPKVLKIQFKYSQWITQDDYQGELIFVLENAGDRQAENFTLCIYDSALDQSKPRVLIYEEIIPIILPDNETTIKLDWRTSQPGLHRISTQIKRNNKLFNTYRDSFYTIPKGSFTIEDSVLVQQQAHTIYDIPYVGKIFFDSSSSVVKGDYVSRWIIEPTLALFAKRLKKNPGVKIQLRGTIDPNSDEHDISLANSRAKAVQNMLILLGVKPEQIKTLAGVALLKRRVPRNSQDARWVFEERRRVDILTEKVWEKKLFDPLQTVYIDRNNLPAFFQANIHGVIPNQTGKLRLQAESESDFQDLPAGRGESNIVGKIEWRMDALSKNRQKTWLNNKVSYSIILTDTLNREFRTYPGTTFLKSEVTRRERRYYVLAKFGNTRPFYDFYWTGLLDIIPFLLEEKNLRLRFEGHGCATGPTAVNNRLSKKRARGFQNKFLKDVRQRYPDLYNEVKQRLDSSKGFGEDEPFEIKSSNGKPLLVGENQTPLGRQLNRRVMVLISSRQ